MADDLPGLLGPGAIRPVTRDLPRQDESPSRQKRPPRRAAPPPPKPSDDAAAKEPPVVGTRLNVRA